MEREPDDGSRGDVVREVERIEEEIEERNPDPLTKREAMEREVAEEGLSEEAGEVADVVEEPDAADSGEP